MGQTKKLLKTVEIALLKMFHVKNKNRGGYVPLNSLTITSLYKNEKSGESKTASSSPSSSSFKPWWADLQQVGFKINLKNKFN